MHDEELINWAKHIEPLNGLVLIKAIWKCAGPDYNREYLIKVPRGFEKHAQPFTLALVLNPGDGYRSGKTGEFIGTCLKAGDIVIANQYSAFPIEIEGRLVNYIPLSHVIAKVLDA